MPPLTPPDRGALVRVRSRAYLAVDVDRKEPEGPTWVRLACLDDDAPGAPLEVLWESELDAAVLSDASFDASQPADPPRRFLAYLETLRWNAVTATDPKLFQAPFRAGIEVMAYQLEPLRKALLLPRVNLFIADDVGLGKTIEAGLVLRELIYRQKVRRVVIAAPPSIVLQWRDEMAERFGLNLVVFDREFVQRVRRDRGHAINPWETHSNFIISHALLRDENYAGPLKIWLGDGGESSRGTLLILDEAHNAAPASGAKYAIDSQFTRAIRDLAPRFEHRLFLSATPHNGLSNSFSALLELLDPQRFVRGVPPDPKRLDEVMVRRLKSDLRRSIHEGLPERQIHQVELDGLPKDAPELSLFAALDKLWSLSDARVATQSHDVRSRTGLTLTLLQKRLLSSVAAFSRTLDKVKAAWLGRLDAAARAPKQLAFPLIMDPVGTAGDDTPGDADELEEAAMLAATLDPTGPGEGGPASPQRERELLDWLERHAKETRHLPDARVRWTIDFIREHFCPDLGKPGAAWTPRRLLIFTEYAETLRYLQHALGAAVATSDRGRERIGVFHGSDLGDDQRTALKAAFQGDPSAHPIRILLATDAAREGVNLQNHCSHLIHMDLPWNPSRLEQRNGRIDRKLQREKIVHCYYFSYLQRPADKVLVELAKRTFTVTSTLLAAPQVLEERAVRVLGRGLGPMQRGRALGEVMAEVDPRRVATVDDELESRREKDIDKQLRDLRDLLERSRKATVARADALRHAMDEALALAGEPGFQPIVVPDLPLPAFAAPVAQLLQNPAWRDTVDTLRKPNSRQIPLWEWRNASPPRPIVFESPKAIDDRVVHVHLEHRLTRRLLGRFTAQGFSAHELSRRVVTYSDATHPRLVLIARLVLYGPAAARLHEQLFTTSAVVSADRSGRLSVEKLADQEDMLDRVADALIAFADTPVSAEMKDLASHIMRRDLPTLEAHVGRRAETIRRDADALLSRRGAAEAELLRKTLDRQVEFVKATLEKSRQATLDFDGAERRQLEDNVRHWQARLAAIPSEREAEPGRIEAGYRVEASRLERVGVVLLWPRSG